MACPSPPLPGPGTVTHARSGRRTRTGPRRSLSTCAATGARAPPPLPPMPSARMADAAWLPTSLACQPARHAEASLSLLRMMEHLERGAAACRVRLLAGDLPRLTAEQREEADTADRWPPCQTRTPGCAPWRRAHRHRRCPAPPEVGTLRRCRCTHTPRLSATLTRSTKWLDKGARLVKTPVVTESEAGAPPNAGTTGASAGARARQASSGPEGIPSPIAGSTGASATWGPEADSPARM